MVASKFSGWLFFFCAAALAACTQTASRQEPALQRPDLMEALPPEARHAFLPPDPSWRKKVTWLELHADADGHLNSYKVWEIDPHQRTWPHVEQFFDNMTAQPRKERRLMPDGRVAYEKDNIGGQSWMREMRADGSTSTYRFYIPGERLEAAYSSRADGSYPSVIIDGMGELLDWSWDGTTCTRTIVRKGVSIVGEEFSAEGCRSVGVSFARNGDWMTHERSREFLSLGSHEESWTFENGVVTGNIPHFEDRGGTRETVAPDDLHRKLEGLTSDRFASYVQSGRTPAAPLTREDYMERREEFMRRAEAFFKENGVSWESLGLVGLRDDPTASLPEVPRGWFGGE